MTAGVQDARMGNTFEKPEPFCERCLVVHFNAFEAFFVTDISYVSISFEFWHPQKVQATTRFVNPAALQTRSRLERQRRDSPQTGAGPSCALFRAWSIEPPATCGV